MIYLAGSCASEQRTLMMNIAKHLRDYGKDVYCPFELKIENAWNYSQEEWSQLVFEADKTAIDKCDIFLIITPGRIGTAGTNWEQGYAYATKKRVIVIQYTDCPTSLMTYCACNTFVNTTTEKIYKDIMNAITGPDQKGRCETTLT